MLPKPWIWPLQTKNIHLLHFLEQKYCISKSNWIPDITLLWNKSHKFTGTSAACPRTRAPWDIPPTRHELQLWGAGTSTPATDMCEPMRSPIPAVAPQHQCSKNFIFQQHPSSRASLHLPFGKTKAEEIQSLGRIPASTQHFSCMTFISKGSVFLLNSPPVLSFDRHFSLSCSSRISSSIKVSSVQFPN